MWGFMKMTKEQLIIKLCHKKLNVFDVISLYKIFSKLSFDDMNFYYSDIAKRQEEYTICTKDWFITVFQDGIVDTFINSEELEVINLYEYELNKVLKKVGNNARNIGTRKI